MQHLRDVSELHDVEPLLVSGGSKVIAAPSETRDDAVEQEKVWDIEILFLYMWNGSNMEQLYCHQSTEPV